ncbi:MAG TPA: LysE family translocator [Pseudonocardiaceae bacterium]|jgi:threonine/homoserine/homoserine lactone efflux protein|nr:LysE family translocator [Pseudonocardiaceae bacterium]
MPVSIPFVVTCALIVMAPGPSFAVIVNQSIRHGRPAGLRVVAGNTTALTFWATASALGLTALIRTSEIAFTVLKVAGAAYLCFLGVQTLLRSRRHARPAGQADEPPARTGWAAYRAGLFTNLTNPKAAVLYLALFPQFLPPGGGLTDVFELAAVQMCISACWYCVVVFAVAGVRRLLAKSVVRTWLDRATSVVLIGLGVRLVALGRPLAG